MSRIFAITTASDRLATGGDGRGEITFTVTNSSTRALRGQVRVRPLGLTRGEWLNITGETERNFSPNATQQVVVKVAPPPGTPAGNYQFRLDTVSLINPDDDFTEGPTIALEVKATEAPKKAFPWWIIAASGAAVILIFALTWMLWPKGLEVPDVVGLEIQQAARIFEASKFGVEITQQPHESVAINRVFAQEPAGKSRAKEGATVTLFVAAPKTAAPKPVETRPAEPKPAELKIVFEDNFEGGAKPGWSQTKTEMTPGSRTRFLGQFWSDSVGLSLNNIPPHKTVTLKFDLYVLHTWDGDVSGDGPDAWGVKLDGSPDNVYTTFSNQDGGRQKFACRGGDEASPNCQAGNVGATVGAAAINSLGFNPFQWLKNKDCVYKIKRTFTHDRNYLALNFFGQLRESLQQNQNLGNEAWGLDNVRIEVQ